MSAALIAQLKNMTDAELESVLVSMVEKVKLIKATIALTSNVGNNFDSIDKLEWLKEKYSYVEQELAIRLIIAKEQVTTLIDVDSLKIIETESAQAIIDELQGLLVAR